MILFAEISNGLLSLRHDLLADKGQLIQTGQLCLTNKRLLFEGRQKNSNIPYDRIKAVSLQSGGLLIEKDKGKNSILEFSGDKTVVEILLERIAKEFKGYEFR